MAFLDRFEKGVERAVNGAFAKASRSEVKPVDLASALRRELDDKAAVLARGRAVVPNEFVIELAPQDFDRILDWGAEAMGEELKRGWPGTPPRSATPSSGRSRSPSRKTRTWRSVSSTCARRRFAGRSPRPGRRRPPRAIRSSTSKGSGIC